MARSIRKLLAMAADRELFEVIRELECLDNDIRKETADLKMKYLLETMRSTDRCYNREQRSNSGLSGGEGGLVEEAFSKGILLGGDYLNQVIAKALKTAECNACMKKIVAAPTAGSCGVIPAVLLPLECDEEKLIEALYIAAGFGDVAANRACIAGAAGGCQAEIGVASAMAAAALVHIMGGSDSQCADAFAIALSNLLGLVCDPVAGLVEIPCVKRNVTGALNAIASANMVIAGCSSPVPADEVLDAMMEIGEQMNSSLKETGIGGLAGTPTGRKIAESLKNR